MGPTSDVERVPFPSRLGRFGGLSGSAGHWRAQVAVNHPRKLWGFKSLPAPHLAESKSLTTTIPEEACPRRVHARMPIRSSARWAPSLELRARPAVADAPTAPLAGESR